jgi:hypothetical protein
VERTLVGLGLKLEREIASEPHHRRIRRGSKKDFAEKVVPTLPSEAFANFAQLFELIERTIAELDSLRGGR